MRDSNKPYYAKEQSISNGTAVTLFENYDSCVPVGGYTLNIYGIKINAWGVAVEESEQYINDLEAKMSKYIERLNINISANITQEDKDEIIKKYGSWEKGLEELEKNMIGEEEMENRDVFVSVTLDKLKA